MVLVAVLASSFTLHMRPIPKFTGPFAYNLASIFGLASVIMTYYGVNYYLSGLHFYASGPCPHSQLGLYNGRLNYTAQRSSSL
jgi:hypothetical protein